MQDIVEKSTRRILIVDDDQLQLRAASRLAKRDPRIELLLASNAIDALLMIGTSRPDLVVLDVFMPGLDGIEACRRIKANPETRDIQVILASATMDAELAETAHAAGAAHAVGKPIDLAARVRRAGRDREQTDELEPARRAARPRASRDDARRRPARRHARRSRRRGRVRPARRRDLAGARRADRQHDPRRSPRATRAARCSRPPATRTRPASSRVVAVTSGPGVLNAMTGLASAWCDGLPVLLLVGEVPRARARQGRAAGRLGARPPDRRDGAPRHQARRRGAARRARCRTCCAARSRPRCRAGEGPVMLTLPIDVTTAQVAPPRVGGAVTIGETRRAETLDELVELLRDAERPLILAGSGVRGGGAPARLRAVAERLRLPGRDDAEGQGRVPRGSSARARRARHGRPPARRARYLESGVDVVLAIGTSLGDMATDGFAPQLQASRALVHVDIDARQIGKSYAPTHAIVASAARAPRRARRARSTRRRCAAAPRELVGGVERHALPVVEHARSDRVARRDPRDPARCCPPTRSSPSTPASTSCSRCTTSRSRSPTRSS